MIAYLENGMIQRRWIAWCGLALLLLLTGCGGCRRSAVENLPVPTDNPGVDALAPPPQLDRPGIENLTKADLEGLARAADRYCQAITQLGGRVSVSVDLSFTKVTDAETARLAFPAATQSVNFSETAIGDDTVAGFAKLTGLRSAMLAATKITDRSVSHLQQLPQLTAVDLMRTEVSSEGQAALMGVLEARAAANATPRSETPANWAFDRAIAEAAKSAAADMDHYAAAVAKFGGSVDIQLDFSRLPLADADVEKIPLPGSVRGIDLSYTKVTDETLKQLRNHAPLERIALIKTSISDAGVKELIEMPNLCEANLEGTNISFPSRMALTKALTPHLSAKANRRGR